MQRKLLGIISVGFNATGQLLITYSTFIKCLRKYGNTVKQCISYKYRLQESLSSGYMTPERVNKCPNSMMDILYNYDDDDNDDKEEEESL